MSDEELFARRDLDGLAILIDRYQGLIFTIALRIVKDEGEAEDVVQNVFIEIWRKAKLFNPQKGTFQVWITRYAYTRSMDQRDYLEHRRFYKDNELTNEPRAKSCTEQVLVIQEAVGKLPDHERRAFERIAIEGLTLAEAAEVLKLTLSCVRNHYFRGLIRLRRILA